MFPAASSAALLRLNVRDLRAELGKRGMDTQGTKAELCQRLAAVMDSKLDDSTRDTGANVNVDVASDRADYDNVQDNVDVTVDAASAAIRDIDSASQVSTRSSSSSVRLRRAEEAAKCAENEVKMKLLQERQRIKREVARLRDEEEIMEMREALEVSKAREATFRAHEERKITVPTVPKVEVFSSRVQPPQPQTHSRTHPATDTTYQHLQAENPPTHPSSPPSPLVFQHSVPRLTLTKFAGSPGEWPRWYALFRVTIHENPLLTTTEKLIHLQTSVTGPAAATIAGMAYDGSMYGQAVEALQARFGRQTDIVYSYLKAIMEAPSPTSADITGLEKLHTCIHCAAAVFEEFRYEGDLTSMENLRRIAAKLPMDLRRKWTEHMLAMEPQRPTLHDLDRWLGEQVRIARNCAAIVEGDFRGRRHPVVAATTQVTVATQKSCAYCGQNHDVQECRRLASASDEDKRTFIRSGALCFGCLRKGHRSADCRRRATCKTCQRRHPTCLHRNPDDQHQLQQSLQHGLQQNLQHGLQQSLPHGLQQSLPQHQETRQESEPYHRNRQPLQQHQQLSSQQRQDFNPTGATSFRVSGDTRASTSTLPLVPVIIHAGATQIHTVAFLDGGSTHSFISQSLFDSLDLANVPRSHLSLTTVDRDVRVQTQVAHHLKLTDVQGQNEMNLPPLYTLQKIPISDVEYPRQEDIARWEHLKDVQLPVQEGGEVGLLLGANAHLAMEPLQVVPSRQGSPYAVQTRYGWIVVGAERTRNAETATVSRIAVREGVADIEEKIRDLYNHEYEEGLHWDTLGCSVEDKLWTKMVESSVELRDDHYMINLPLVGQELPNNQVMAEKRLASLKTRFAKNEKFAEDYRNYMEEMIKKKYAEPVPQEDAQRSDGKVWYLPHHAVFHRKKPEKVRVVFDCAATYQGVCLNDRLLQGPDQTTPLLDVLMRFRADHVAFIADVEGMFNQVQVPCSNRDVFRFLWWRDGYPDNEVNQYRMTVHIFGAKSSPSVACYALRRTAMDNEADFSPAATTTVMKNFYVDDVLKATASEEDAISLARELKELCRRGGFNLTKFSSNSAAVVAAFPPEDRSKEMKQWTGLDKSLPDERALGLVWETKSDSLRIAVEMRNMTSKPLTRRGLMSAVCSLYDPLGMVSPTVLQGRLILQELCRIQVEWDGEIPSEQQRQWLGWLKSIERIDQLGVSRCIKPREFGDVTSYQMHHFADASQVAYGTVSYVRMTNAVGDIHCAFVMGKAHLAPLKTVTIPRLELMAAVTAVKVSYLISRAVEFETSHTFWTDSTTVLRFIRNSKTRYHTFVANRLAVIHDGTTPEQWHFVPSEHNPADDVSRGIQSDRWIAGPDFLWQDEDEWPSEPAALQDTSANDPEVKISPSVMFVMEDEEFSPMQRLAESFSTWSRLVRAVAWIRRVLRTLRERCRGFGSPPSSRLSVSDLEDAEKHVLKFVQETSFPQELKDLRAGKEVRTSSVLARLDPFVKDDLLRVGGRLVNSALDGDRRHPLILPSKGTVVDLLVSDVHQRAGHEGRQQVMSELRRQYWILKANSAVRRCLNQCRSCRRRLRPPESQKMANLPADRVEPVAQPFLRSGVDYFGPFFVKEGRRQVKRYGVIFTCLSMRAVHIEVAEDLSSDSFICALRRFVARRGRVQFLRSDRGTNFVGANRELREELEKMAASDDHLHRAMLNMGVEWVFNTAAASHHGGVWERHIRSIRRILDALLGSQALKDETLRTFLCEAENILNSRPLTPVSLDPRDPEPLTPNHLLLLSTGSVMMPFGLVSGADSADRKRWKQARYLADAFWRRWRAEYLPLLQERPHVMTRKRANVSVDDVVLVVDASVPRGQWPMGRVIDVKTGSDGLVRSVRVKVRGVVLERPITKLVKLQCGQ